MTDAANKTGIIFFPLKPSPGGDTEMISRSLMKHVSSKIEATGCVAASFIYMVLRDDSGALRLYVPDNLGTEELVSDYREKTGQQSSFAVYGDISEEGEDFHITLFLYDYAAKRSAEFFDGTFLRERLPEAPGEMAAAIIGAADPDSKIFGGAAKGSASALETKSGTAFFGYLSCLDAIAGRNPYVPPPEAIALDAVKAFAADPLFQGPVDVISFIADDYIRFDMKNEALAMLTEALKISREPRVLLASAKAQLSSGEIEGAFKAMREALSMKPGMGEVARNMGQLASELGRIEDAAFAYKAMIACGHDLPVAYDNLGVLMAQGGDVEGACDCWHRAIEFDPKKASAFCNLGRAAIESGDLGKAMDYLKKSLAANPDFFMTHLNMAELYKKRGEHDRAKSCIEKAMRLNPELSFTKPLREKLQKANELTDSDRDEDAMAIFDEIVGENGMCWQAWFFRGIALRKLKRFDEAEKSFLKSAEINAKFPDSRNELGVIYLAKRKLDDALMLFQSASELSPNHHGFLCNLGLCLMEMGRFEEARQNFSKAKFLKPGDKKIDELFAVLAEREKKAAGKDSGS